MKDIKCHCGSGSCDRAVFLCHGSMFFRNGNGVFLGRDGLLELIAEAQAEIGLLEAIDISQYDDELAKVAY